MRISGRPRRTAALARLATAAALATPLLLVAPVAPAHATLPSAAEWAADVDTAMAGSHRFLEERATAYGAARRLAVNLDIDNTALASHYDSGNATPRVLRFARKAERLGIDVLFNTAREESKVAAVTRVLRREGYAVDDICGRRSGESVVESKQRCRADFTADGWTIVANVGNRSTDFEGGDYERAFRLPSYGNQLR